MVKIQIGSIEKDLDGVDQHWLCNEINGRRKDGKPDCVRVRIDDDDVHLALSTPACVNGPGGFRPLTPREAEIVDLWRKEHLNEPRFSCGNVNAFLVRLRHLL